MIVRNTVLLGIVMSSALMTACSSTPKAEPIAEPQLAAAEPAPIRQTARGPVLTVDDVLFDFEAATLRPEARRIVTQAVRYLKDNPDRMALIEGHTDNTGEADYNQYLSDERTGSVSEALQLAGISSDRIVEKGFGESHPIASNATLEGRQKNRRVEIVFKPLSWRAANADY